MKSWKTETDDREKYGLYLASREWSVLKEAVHARAKGVCERCNVNKIDAVHHLTYIRKYEEQLDDLQGLCKGCHDFNHGKSDVDPKSPSLGYLGFQWLCWVEASDAKQGEQHDGWGPHHLGYTWKESQCRFSQLKHPVDIELQTHFPGKTDYFRTHRAPIFLRNELDGHLGLARLDIADIDMFWVWGIGREVLASTYFVVVVDSKFVSKIVSDPRVFAWAVWLFTVFFETESSRVNIVGDESYKDIPHVDALNTIIPIDFIDARADNYKDLYLEAGIRTARHFEGCSGYSPAEKADVKDGLDNVSD